VAASRVYLEEAKSNVFAVSLDWPGWCRRGKTPEAAIEALESYRERYARVLTVPFDAGTIQVIETLPGNATTEFGAPNVIGPWDAESLSPKELNRRIAVLQDCWNYFDAVVDAAPAKLRKGPRGGGRDRDAIADHVREAERASCSRAGFRVAPRTPWDEQRDVVVTTMRATSPHPKWPSAYALRWCAWHVLDHAWEIEDKSE
jgi:hypothetical protein